MQFQRRAAPRPTSCTSRSRGGTVNLSTPLSLGQCHRRRRARHRLIRQDHWGSCALCGSILSQEKGGNPTYTCKSLPLPKKKQDVLEPSPLRVELSSLCITTATPRATFFVAVLKDASIATMRDTEQAHTTRKTEGRVWVPSTTGDKTCTQDTHQQHSTPRERERDRKTRN